MTGLKIQALSCSQAPTPSSSSLPSSPMGNGQPQCESLEPVRHAVENLAEACAPGVGNADGADGGVVSPGLSLVKSARSCEGRRGSDGSFALLGACAALHGYLLEWLSMTEHAEGGGAGGSEEAGSCGGGGASGGGSLTLSGKARWKRFAWWSKNIASLAFCGIPIPPFPLRVVLERPRMHILV